MRNQTVNSLSSRSDGFFAPDSMIWRIDREMALLLAGGRALLLQLAHPKIAAGVAAHSRFQDNPLGRLQRTMSAMWSIVFDDLQTATTTLLHVKGIHQRVRGTVGPAEGPAPETRYDAGDVDLLLWVHATLVDSAIRAYELFVGRLSGEERSRYYDDARKLGRLFDIPDGVQPLCEAAFQTYFNDMLTGSTLAVGPAARALARDILYPRPWILRPAAPLFRLVTAGLLPERLRGDYGLRWSKPGEKIFALFARFVRAARPCLPRVVRLVPNARAAERRLALSYQAAEKGS